MFASFGCHACIAGGNRRLIIPQTPSERAIDLLLERRTALVSAAVTGKIDVRSVSRGDAEGKA